MRIVSLYRYPVKGLSPEPLNSVAVQAGDGFPLDRKFALLHSGADFDPSAPTWLAKANFLMLTVHEKLASLRTRYDDAERILSDSGTKRRVARRRPGNDRRGSGPAAKNRG